MSEQVCKSTESVSHSSASTKNTENEVIGIKGNSFHSPDCYHNDYYAIALPSPCIENSVITDIDKGSSAETKTNNNINDKACNLQQVLNKNIHNYENKGKDMNAGVSDSIVMPHIFSDGINYVPTSKLTSATWNDLSMDYDEKGRVMTLFGLSLQSLTVSKMRLLMTTLQIKGRKKFQRNKADMLHCIYKNWLGNGHNRYNCGAVGVVEGVTRDKINRCPETMEVDGNNNNVLKVLPLDLNIIETKRTEIETPIVYGTNCSTLNHIQHEASKLENTKTLSFLPSCKNQFYLNAMNKHEQESQTLPKFTQDESYLMNLSNQQHNGLIHEACESIGREMDLTEEKLNSTEEKLKVDIEKETCAWEKYQNKMIETYTMKTNELRTKINRRNFDYVEEEEDLLIMLKYYMNAKKNMMKDKAGVGDQE